MVSEPSPHASTTSTMISITTEGGPRPARDWDAMNQEEKARIERKLDEILEMMWSRNASPSTTPAAPTSAAAPALGVGGPSSGPGSSATSGASPAVPDAKLVFAIDTTSLGAPLPTRCSTECPSSDASALVTLEDIPLTDTTPLDVTATELIALGLGATPATTALLDHVILTEVIPYNRQVVRSVSGLSNIGHLSGLQLKPPWPSWIGSGEHLQLPMVTEEVTAVGGLPQEDFPGDGVDMHQLAKFLFKQNYIGEQTKLQDILGMSSSSWHQEHMQYHTPWPPPYLYLNWCDSSKLRPIPWPSFSDLPDGVHLTEPMLPLQGTYGDFSVVGGVSYPFPDSLSWIKTLHIICLRCELDREEKFISVRRTAEREEQFTSLGMSLNIPENFLKQFTYLYLSWCDKSMSRPAPWPSFAEVPGGVHLTEPRPLLQESVEGILSLIRRGASVFKLWHIPWFSFLFTGLIIEAKKVLITWSLTNMSCCNTTTVHASTGTMDVELWLRYQMAMGMEMLDMQRLRGFSILVVSIYNTLVAETVITEFQLPNLLYHHQASKIRPVPMVELLQSLVQLNYRVQDLGLGSVCKLSGNITKSGILFSWLPQAKPPDGTTGLLMNQHSRLRFVLVGVSIAAAKLVSWFIGHINQCGFGLPNWKTAWSRQWGCSEMVAWLVLVTRFRPENHDKYILIIMKIQHRIFVSLYCVSKSLQLSVAPFELYVTFLPVEMDPTSTEAWEQGVCVLQSGCNPSGQLPTAPFLNVQQLLGCPSLIDSDFIQGVPCDNGFSAAACVLYALDQFLVAFSTSSEIVSVYHMLHSSFSWLGEAQLSFYEHDTDTCMREPIQAANDENHGCTRSQAISGMTPSTRYNQAPFQEGRDVMFVTAVLVEDLVDLEYHLTFGWDYADDFYGLDWISIHRNYFYLAEEYSNFDYHRDSDNIQELRVHWDPGGCWWWSAWGQAAFQEGRDVRSLSLNGLFPGAATWAWPVCQSPRAAGYINTWRRHRRGYPGSRTNRPAAPASSSPVFLSSLP